MERNEALIAGLADELDRELLPDESQQRIGAEALRRDLQGELDRFFVHHRISVEIDPELIAKAAAGPTRIRLRGGGHYSEYDRHQLLEHEAFVHSLTALNGREQPHMKSLARTSPRITATQEGLATFAELITGAIDIERMKRISLRIIAIDMALRGRVGVEIGRDHEPVMVVEPADQVLVAVGIVGREHARGDRLQRLLQLRRALDDRARLARAGNRAAAADLDEAGDGGRRLGDEAAGDRRNPDPVVGDEGGETAPQPEKLDRRKRQRGLARAGGPEDQDSRIPGDDRRGVEVEPPGHGEGRHSSAGRVTTKRAPWNSPGLAPAMFSAVSLPPCASTIWRLIDRPRPEFWPKASPAGRSV